MSATYRRWFLNTGEQKYVENWPYTADVTLRCWCGHECLGLRHRINHEEIHPSKYSAARVLVDAVRKYRLAIPDPLSYANITHTNWPQYSAKFKERGEPFLRGITS